MIINNIEKEIIYLLAIKQLIDEMVNFEVINPLCEGPEVEVHFKSMTHQKFFNIILVDFLSCADAQILGEKQPYLRALASICENPSFDQNNSIENLKKIYSKLQRLANQRIYCRKHLVPLYKSGNKSINKKDRIY